MTGTTAIVHGQVDGWKATLDRDEAEAGFCWSKENSNPTIEGGNFKSQKISAYEFVGEETVSINGKMTSLTPNTTYYYRSFLYMNEEYYYGEVKEFKTVEEKQGMCPDGNHPHMIDLGLPSGTKWACCNVGASAPEEYGGYYAWGEVSEKQHYNYDTYQYAHQDGGYINIGTHISGTQYDVSYNIWGNPWCMPSVQAFEELIGYCNCQFAVINDINGIKFVGTNGNSIFFPYAGFKNNLEHSTLGEYGLYWTDTSYGNEDNVSSDAYWLSICSVANMPIVNVLNNLRVFGASVRPISK